MLIICPDCGAKPDQYHDIGCDVERCPDCGGQYIGCFCNRDEAIGTHERLKWEGRWPGEKECEEYDLWCVWDPPNGPNGTGFRPCSKDTPGAVHNLNKLAVMRWDPKLRKHVK